MRSQSIKGNWSLNQKRKGAMTVESAIFLPICFYLIIFIFQLGVLFYDSYNFSTSIQRWVTSQIDLGNEDWQSGIQALVDQKLIYPQEIDMVEVGPSFAVITMRYKFFWTIRTRVELPKDHREKLYHFINARHLINRIPILDQVQEKYFKSIQKLKVD